MYYKVSMKKRYIVELTQQERKLLKGIVKRGKGPAYRIRHAYVLLHADKTESGKTDEEIAGLLHCHGQTVFNIRKKYSEEGLTRAVGRKTRESLPVPRKLDGAQEARLITIACSQPPDGYVHWTLDLLADKMVELKIVDTISGKTVGRVLKKRVKASPAAMLGHSAATKR
jgi:transposase